ncbi:MAG: PEGA domain-containing protein, partial [Pseudomonadales bacterium]
MSDQPTSKVLAKRQLAKRRNLRTAIGAILLAALGTGIADWVSSDAGVLKKLAFGAGDLKVISEPPGAEVFIDGRVVGVTPLELDALLSGEYAVLVKHPYYMPHVESLLVERGSSHHRTIRLQQAFGSLSLASNPEGAIVSINGQPLEQATPLHLAKLQAGNHQVTFSIFGRQLITREFEVLPNARVELVVELNRLDTSALTINTRPSWATVKLLHVPVKYEPGVRVPTGEYQIEVTASGYESQTRTHELRVGVNVIDVTLQRAKAMLHIDTTPPDAVIQVRVDSDVNLIAYQQDMKLPIGPIELRVHRKGYRKVVKQIDLSPSGRSLHLTLASLDVVVGQHIRDTFRDGSGHAPEVIVIGEGTAISPRGSGNVTVTEPYAIGVTEVTVGEYRAFAVATAG